DRTAALRDSNDDLRREIVERQNAERLFRTFTETASDGVVIANDEGSIVFFNAAAERIFGYTAAEATSRPFRMLVREEPGSEDAGIGRYLRSGEWKRIDDAVEIAGLRSDGTEFPLEVSLSVARSSGGILFTGIFRDITRRKQA